MYYTCRQHGNTDTTGNLYGASQVRNKTKLTTEAANDIKNSFEANI